MADAFYIMREQREIHCGYCSFMVELDERGSYVDPVVEHYKVAHKDRLAELDAQLNALSRKVAQDYGDPIYMSLDGYCCTYCDLKITEDIINPQSLADHFAGLHNVSPERFLQCLIYLARLHKKYHQRNG